MIIKCPTHGKYRVKKCENYCPVCYRECEPMRFNPFRGFKSFWCDYWPALAFVMVLVTVATVCCYFDPQINPSKRIQVTAIQIEPTPTVKTKTYEEFLQEFPAKWRAIYISMKDMDTYNATCLMTKAVEDNRDELFKEWLKPEQVKYFTDIVYGCGKHEDKVWPEGCNHKYIVAQTLIPFVKDK